MTYVVEHYCISSSFIYLTRFRPPKKSTPLFSPNKITRERGFRYYLVRVFACNAVLTKSIGTSWAGTIEYAYVKKNITN